MTVKTRVQVQYLVRSRAIYDKNGEGNRFSGGKVHKGRWITWNAHQDNNLNLREAIIDARSRLKLRHIGTVVYIVPFYNGKAYRGDFTPLYDAKWGHDNLPYMSWKDNPPAMYWRRRISVKAR